MARNKIELDLVENGKDSLRHAVQHFTAGSEPSDLKYAIRDVFHAIELFFKAALANHHPTLVFQKPEERNFPSARTVDFDTLIARLKAVGVEFDDEELKTIRAVRTERNKIEHYKVEVDHKQVSAWIGRIFRFLEGFIEEELSLTLKGVLDQGTYRLLAETVYSYEELLEKAQASLPGGSSDDYFCYQYVECPKCEHDTVPYPDPEFVDGRVRCRFCDAEFHATSCNSCGGAMLDEPTLDEDDIGRCSACWMQMFAHAE